MTESDIQNQIRVALSPHGIVFRTNSGDFWQGEQVYSKEFKQPVLIHLRRICGLPKGFSDLLFCGFDGQAGFIEVKKPGGHIRKEQTDFLNLMRSYGYMSGIARSPEDALLIVQHKFI
ncbi:hypothetical protein CAFE_18660 [Caprobacter fermentans]|uniref:VRR-NUC domain-containing protein n=1 Tax=Caproicibacter fermentans TaxID=2576756 RepID=A0A6N8I067_9FIRM|nr:VRR-NUC domain-containing protein [Caproicibacter fermentans]MVB11160.1 hypothetical protein [Caproicibacter fermentans]